MWVPLSKFTCFSFILTLLQCDNFSFAAALGMLVIDTLLYSFLTWYIEVGVAFAVFIIILHSPISLSLSPLDLSLSHN